MYDAGNCHYYISELAQLKSGEYIIPVRWLEDIAGKIFADAYSVVFDNEVSIITLIFIDLNLKN